MVARRESGRSRYAITSSRQLGEQRVRLFQSAAVWPQQLLQPIEIDRPSRASAPKALAEQQRDIRLVIDHEDADAHSSP